MPGDEPPYPCTDGSCMSSVRLLRTV
ncbi:MAG: hypothetical protein QOE98_2411, partial [Gaiellaceae bacterium]|nr:hypothetical protein [Gaiellaceae bacterium]